MNQYHLQELLICRNLLEDSALQALLQAVNTPEPSTGAKAVSMLIEQAEQLGLAGDIIRAYTLHLLTHTGNLASRTSEKCHGKLGSSLKKAFVHDMELLSPLLSTQGTLSAFPLLADYHPTKALRTEAWEKLQELMGSADTAESMADALLTYYRRYGYGDIASYRAFQWDNGKLAGIRHFETIRMNDLIGYAHQKEQLIGNTEAFVAGRPANHVLLVGARGTGKSSGVKALANEYYSEGLRLLQLTKPQLRALPEIMETLRQFSSKRFIIFMDDLSFEESDAEYKYLKSAIEGGVSSRPENVLIYATSNRRHLIRESWRDRIDGQDELYRDDSIQETISLSDRFGLIIHYYAPDQSEYLAIIRHMLKKQGIEMTDEQLRVEGLRWEMSHSGRSGRTAQQFVAHYLGHKSNS
ncbi:MAG: ATP-binding protein [Selenomonadaceae bacterium]|nr:ATP-binding protein [Selenomonadaceae bacterium]MBR6711220.1 ATP-binding protein [Selenomonadaceae bacterium]